MLCTLTLCCFCSVLPCLLCNWCLVLSPWLYLNSSSSQQCMNMCMNLCTYSSLPPLLSPPNPVLSPPPPPQVVTGHLPCAQPCPGTQGHAGVRAKRSPCSRGVFFSVELDISSPCEVVSKHVSDGHTSHEGNYTRSDTRVWLAGVALAPQIKCTGRAAPRRGLREELRGGVSGEGQQVVEAMRSGGGARGGRLLAAAPCDLIYLWRRSLWLPLASGLWGGERWKARVCFVSDQAETKLGVGVRAGARRSARGGASSRQCGC